MYVIFFLVLTGTACYSTRLRLLSSIILTVHNKKQQRVAVTHSKYNKKRTQCIIIKKGIYTISIVYTWGIHKMDRNYTYQFHVAAYISTQHN